MNRINEQNKKRARKPKKVLYVDKTWRNHTMEYYRSGMTSASEKYCQWINGIIDLYIKEGKEAAWELYLSQLSDSAKSMIEYFRWTEFRYLEALAREKVAT